jgi:hypothetical protein
LTGAVGVERFHPTFPDDCGCMNGVLSGLGKFIASSNVGAGNIGYKYKVS